MFFLIGHVINWKHNRMIKISGQNNYKIRSLYLCDFSAYTFLYKKTIFCLSLNFLNILLEIKLRFLKFYLNVYLFIFFNCLFNYV